MFNPYVILIAGAAFLAACGYSYWSGYSRASESCQAEKWKSQFEAMTKERNTWKVAAESASKSRDEIEAKLAEQEKQGEEFKASLDPKIICQDPVAARNLRERK